jgi:hypothetical protein
MKKEATRAAGVQSTLDSPPNIGREMCPKNGDESNESNESNVKKGKQSLLSQKRIGRPIANIETLDSLPLGPTAADRRRAHARERSQRYRDRKAEGWTVLQIMVQRDALAEQLIAMRHLAEADCDDLDEVRAAAETMLAFLSGYDPPEEA